MTKKKIILLVSVIIVLAIAGVASVYVYRNINEVAPVVVDQTPRNTVVEGSTPVAAVTTFTATLNGVDAIHWGKGTVEVIDTNGSAILSFGEDVEVAQGPDLFVYLSPNAGSEELGEFASLGVLKANKGAQEYNLPDDYKNYKSVVIWCRAIGVKFATADLQ